MGQGYPFLLAAAGFASLIWIGRQPATRVEAGLIVGAGGIVGARLGFVALHASYFGAHPIEAAWLWQGGLSWVGAAAGAAAGVVLAARATSISPWVLADALCVPAAVLSLACWTGCLVDACSYGRRVGEASWAPEAYDAFGVVARRWPTQALGMILSGTLLAGLLRPAGAWPAGLSGSVTLAALAAINTILSLTRGDPSLLIGGWRVDTVAGAAVFITAAVMTGIRWRQP